MDGITLKNRLESTNISLSEIAKRMGLSQQALSSYFKAQDVRSGLLEKLCVALNKDMSFFYLEIHKEEPRVNNINIGDDNTIQNGRAFCELSQEEKDLLPHNIDHDEKFMKYLMEQNKFFADLIKELSKKD